MHPRHGQSLGDGPHRAVHRTKDLIREFVRDLEYGLTRCDVVVIGKGADKVGELPHGAQHPVHAQIVIPTQALWTVLAREDSGVDHPITFMQGLAQGIGGHALAQFVDHAGPFVPHSPPLRWDRVGLRVAPPGMQVRAADTRLSDLQHDIAGSGVRNVVLLDLERLPIGSENNLSPLHGFPSPTGARLTVWSSRSHSYG